MFLKSMFSRPMVMRTPINWNRLIVRYADSKPRSHLAQWEQKNQLKQDQYYPSYKIHGVNRLLCLGNPMQHAATPYHIQRRNMTTAAAAAAAALPPLHRLKLAPKREGLSDAEVSRIVAAPGGSGGGYGVAKELYWRNQHVFAAFPNGQWIGVFPSGKWCTAYNKSRYDAIVLAGVAANKISWSEVVGSYQVKKDVCKLELLDRTDVWDGRAVRPPHMRSLLHRDRTRERGTDSTPPLPCLGNTFRKP